MASAMAGAAFSVVGKALAPVMNPVLEAWAASNHLHTNVQDLKRQLLGVKAVLEHTVRREINNSAVEDLLRMLRDLGYDAEDVLDELYYFRIQDQLDGSFDAVNEHPKGCSHNILLHARHTAKAVGKLLWPPACSSAAAPGAISSGPGTNQANREVNGCMPKLTSSIHAAGKHLPCSSLLSVHRDGDDDDDMQNLSQRYQTDKTPKLRFNRVDASKKMKYIVEQLRQVHQELSIIVSELGPSWSKLPDISQSRPLTTAESIEPKLYGRDILMNSIIHDITHDKYRDKDITVIPIVGPGGIGKTTLAQYIYQNVQVQKHFESDVKIWVCVSLNFDVHRLLEEIVKYIPKVDGERIGTAGERIGQRLKSKRVLLILDDIWECSDEDDWKRLLQPFKKSQVHGNIIIVTTRIPAIAEMVKTTDHPIELEGLGNKEFKELFLAFVFGDDQSRKDNSFLLETGDKIIDKLKGSPLAAKTVGRLLRNNLNLNHWTSVLESKEWESQNNKHDIMPALKLSYEHLPFHLQQCFSYCALYPEDYKFKTEELIHFWIGIDVLHSPGENKRVEDIGLNHLTELVNYGFLKKEDDDECAFYVIHDLLHELAQRVSSHECLSIYSHNVRSVQNPTSIRHLSINIDDTSVKDGMTFGTCQKDLSTLLERLKAENVRSLMLFGKYQGSFVKTFGALFKGTKALRVVFLSESSYNMEELLQYFSDCVHLRYIRIGGNPNQKPLNIVSRLYHLKVLDLEGCSRSKLYSARDMGNLIEIFEVGKLTSLQDLGRFEVKKENQGFELSQIGHLEACRSMGIYNLEKVETKEEADEAKLFHKTHLRKLTLHWDSHGSNKDSAREEQVIESLKPVGNLVQLCIGGHGGATCPSWLGANLSVKNLEILQLREVSWKNLPPLGELWLVDEHGKEFQNYIPRQSFNNLKKLELVKIPKLKKWIGSVPPELASHLKGLIIEDCPELMELPFTRHTGCGPEHEVFRTCFPKLEELTIKRCPKLVSSLPFIPLSSAMCWARIAEVGSGLEKLRYFEIGKFGYCLVITGKEVLDGDLWMVVGFHNLSKLKYLCVARCPPLSLDHLQMLSSLKSLVIHDSRDAILLPGGDGQIGYQFPVEHVEIMQCGGSGEQLTRFLSYFPNVRKLSVGKCEKLTGLGVVAQQKKMEASARHGQPSSSANEVQEEIESSDGLLLLPPRLETLGIRWCPNLVLCEAHSLDDDKSGGGGLHGLKSLRSLGISGCPRFLSPSSYSPFPTSLEQLALEDCVEGMEMLLPLSNLTSLTDLSISGCGDLRGEGLQPLLAQGHLTTLTILKTPNFFAGSESPLPHEQELPSSSSKPHTISTDDVAGVLAAPICTLLSSRLTALHFYEVERFTEKQEEALGLLASLEQIEFHRCDKLQCLPAGLHELSKLKRLQIYDCPAIKSLPKDCLPGSLQILNIYICPAMDSLPKDGLPGSLEELYISVCPAMQLLPKVDNLLNSLRVLDVQHSDNEDLRRQCSKLIGIIPIVKV